MKQSPRLILPVDRLKQKLPPEFPSKGVYVIVEPDQRNHSLDWILVPSTEPIDYASLTECGASFERKWDSKLPPDGWQERRKQPGNAESEMGYAPVIGEESLAKARYNSKGMISVKTKRDFRGQADFLLIGDEKPGEARPLHEWYASIPAGEHRMEFRLDYSIQFTKMRYLTSSHRTAETPKLSLYSPSRAKI